ncbi:MAG TPA: hypothetical protein O0Y06_02350 [Methanocorpusculum sp.]|nr:hypothetical protein [Methanocorpusculum sp.]HJK79725.1 hypothetical protein [Methanocorpusculum sp.]
MHPSADDGLSEVVGFICILALIAVVFSIWAAGGVPAEELQKERDITAAAAVQFSDMKLAMDLLWIAGEPGDARSVMIDAGTLSIGISDAAIHVSDNESASSYFPLRLSYGPEFRYAERFVLSSDCGAVTLLTGGTRSVILPPSIARRGGDVCLTIPVLASPAVEVSKTDPILLRFCVKNIRERRFINASVSVAGDPLLGKMFVQTFDTAGPVNLTVREVLYRIEAA